MVADTWSYQKKISIKSFQLILTNMTVRFTETTASKKEGFEVVCDVSDHNEEYGGDVDCKNGAQESSSQNNLNLDTASTSLAHVSLSDEVLCQVLWSKIVQLFPHKINKLSRISIRIKNHAAGLIKQVEHVI